MKFNTCLHETKRKLLYLLILVFKRFINYRDEALIEHKVGEVGNVKLKNISILAVTR